MKENLIAKMHFSAQQNLYPNFFQGVRPSVEIGLGNQICLKPELLLFLQLVQKPVLLILIAIWEKSAVLMIAVVTLVLETNLRLLNLNNGVFAMMRMKL